MQDKVLQETAHACVADIADGAALLRFRGENGRVNSKTAQWAAEALEKLEDNVSAILVEGCGGYDTDEISALIEAGNQAELEQVALRFQKLTQTIRKLNKPVVAVLDGTVADLGLELAMSADGVCAADAVFSFNTRVNRFPPMGGGITKLALHTYAMGENVPGSDIVPFLKRVFGQLYMGKPCKGLAEAEKAGLPMAMATCCDKDTLIEKAKALALFLAEQGYTPLTQEQGAVVTGTTGAAAMEIIAVNMQRGGFISPEALEIAAGIAKVLGGGNVPKGTLVNEAQFLKLEREAFLAACKRQAREGEKV